ncbi:tryptophan-rich sensory protein [Maribacter chungangensis]|uniref:Tryptophan-rich sensory protein n=1 Tax=Maribacter chungangensis TaxID=1069117 RepID=A0ABW3B7E3_9FLAO
MIAAKQIIQNTLLRWRLFRTAEIGLVSLGIAVLVYCLFPSIWMAAVVFLVAILLYGVWVRPWKFGVREVCSYLDSALKELENSTYLLFSKDEELSAIAKIQQYRTAETLVFSKRKIRLKHKIGKSLGIALGCVGLGLLLQYSGIRLPAETTKNTPPQNDAIVFQPLDSLSVEVVPPVVQSQKITVRYPSYTGKSASVTSDMNVKVLEGSTVDWAVRFNQPIKKAVFQFGADETDMTWDNALYTHRLKASNAGFYSLKFTDTLQNEYLSALYSFEVFKDEPPEVRMNKLPQFSSFEATDSQEFTFTSSITDDFGIADVAIIATVSKGTGESVKFREERLAFDTPLQKLSKSATLQKKMDLRSLRMEPGDELYFYVEVKDNKEPKANITRTETYFSVIKDTATDAFAVEGTMGADLMPDYFRSQRQLIIDTEQLILEKPALKKPDFNFRSNELGFDQKALRIKYGEFMGDETEAPTAPKEIGAATVPGDMLDEYSHKHDGSNEHNLVADEEHDHDHDHDHGDEQMSGADSEEDPLEAYVHNHGDPEASTLFAKSLKSMLKDAMAEMWDAELYLRLYEPEKSLPYQYKALKLIQEIKNSARIYVHRIGFDPPPIKEEKRLSGELKDVKGFRKTEELKMDEIYPNMKAALQVLSLVRAKNRTLSEEDRSVLKAAGDELAVLAIAQPNRYLNTLQNLKWLSEAEQLDMVRINLAYAGLLRALPDRTAVPSASNSYTGQLNHLFLEALESND